MLPNSNQKTSIAAHRQANRHKKKLMTGFPVLTAMSNRERKRDRTIVFFKRNHSPNCLSVRAKVKWKNKDV